jgi:hypothetical protein
MTAEVLVSVPISKWPLVNLWLVDPADSGGQRGGGASELPCRGAASFLVAQTVQGFGERGATARDARASATVHHPYQLPAGSLYSLPVAELLTSGALQSASLTPSSEVKEVARLEAGCVVVVGACDTQAAAGRMNNCLGGGHALGGGGGERVIILDVASALDVGVAGCRSRGREEVLESTEALLFESTEALLFASALLHNSRTIDLNITIDAGGGGEEGGGGASRSGGGGGGAEVARDLGREGLRKVANSLTVKRHSLVQNLSTLDRDVVVRRYSGYLLY